MSLSPTPAEHIARARADMRLGLPVIVGGAGAGTVVVAAEAVSDARLADLRALGPVALVITQRRAATLKAPAYDGDLCRIALPTDADAAWVEAVADPADDLIAPMKGPLQTIRGGNAGPARAAIALAKAAHLLPAALIAETGDPYALAREHGLSLVSLDEITALADALSPLAPVAAARVPLEAATAGRVHVFRPDDGGEEHYAIEIGHPDRDKPVLTRLHSACFTGDVLGSLKCDCGPQLRAALAQMGNAGEGVLLYLNQEGRGIGLANKMRAYSLQDQGFDTVEANHRLGFEDDERDFRIGAALLKQMGFNAVDLLTNNPRKVDMLKAQGITVRNRVPLKVGLNPLNADYLDTKARKSGHLL